MDHHTLWAVGYFNDTSREGQREVLVATYMYDVPDYRQVDVTTQCRNMSNAFFTLHGPIFIIHQES